MSVLTMTRTTAITKDGVTTYQTVSFSTKMFPSSCLFCLRDNVCSKVGNNCGKSKCKQAWRIKNKDLLEQVVKQPVELTVEYPVEQPLEQPVEQPVRQPVEQVVEQPDEYAKNLQVDEAINDQSSQIKIDNDLKSENQEKNLNIQESQMRQFSNSPKSNNKQNEIQEEQKDKNQNQKLEFQQGDQNNKSPIQQPFKQQKEQNKQVEEKSLIKNDSDNQLLDHQLYQEKEDQQSASGWSSFVYQMSYLQQNNNQQRQDYNNTDLSE